MQRGEPAYEDHDAKSKRAIKDALCICGHLESEHFGSKRQKICVHLNGNCCWGFIEINSLNTKVGKKDRIEIWRQLPSCACCANGISNCDPYYPCGVCNNAIEFVLAREQTMQQEAWNDGRVAGMAEAEIKVAGKIFNLAHQYAQDDSTMIGSEELRGYHYLNAIHKIGKFAGR